MSIQFKRSGTPGKVPTTSDLKVGEFAVNVADKKLYTSNGVDIILLNESSGGSGTSTTIGASVPNNNNGGPNDFYVQAALPTSVVLPEPGTWQYGATSTDCMRSIQLIQGSHEYYYTVDGGVTWGKSTYIPVSSPDFPALPGNQRITMSADGFTVLIYAGNRSSIMYITFDGGDTWNETNISAGSNDFIPIMSGDAKNFYVTGTNVFGTRKSTNGTTWVSGTRPSDSGARGFAISNNGQYIINVDSLPGVVTRSTDYGVTWIKNIQVPFSNEVAGTIVNIKMSTSGQRAVAISSNGFFIYSSDYGATWAHSPIPGATGTDFYGIALSGDGLIVLVTTLDKTYRSVNGGATWTYTSMPSGKAIYLDSAGVAGFQLLNGTTILFTSDGGVTWSTTRGIVAISELFVKHNTSWIPFDLTTKTYVDTNTYTKTTIGYEYADAKTLLDNIARIHNGNAIRVGDQSGTDGQTGYAIAIGQQAGKTNQSPNAIAVGAPAGTNNQGSNAIAIGAESGVTKQGVRAIAMGQYAGNDLQSADAVAIGTGAGKTNQSINSIAIGSFAGSTGQSTENVAIGGNAGATNQKTKATSVGYSAGRLNQGQYTVAVGNYAGDDTQADFSVSVGANAGAIKQGQGSVAIGLSAGKENQAGGSVAIGASAGRFTQSISATAVGNGAGMNSQGEGSVAVGINTGATKQATLSVAIGPSSGNTNQGTRAVAIGAAAAMYNQGEGAIAIGKAAQGDPNDATNKQGVRAIAIGDLAAINRQGEMAIAIGYGAAGNVQSLRAIAIGQRAGQEFQGADAIAIGTFAGTNRQGINAIAIGNNAGNVNQHQNSVCIGTNSVSTAINQVVLGGPLMTTVVTTCPEYVDNAEAISAGLMRGTIYRTGDIMKIVH